MSYDQESFLKGLAVGRILWKPPRAIPDIEVFAYTINLSEDPTMGLEYNRLLFTNPTGSVTVEWGDGTDTVYPKNYQGGLNHIYEQSGLYKITITGKMRLFRLTSDPFVVSVDSPLPSTVITAENMFKGSKNLSRVTQHLFRRCGSSVQSFAHCFDGCKSLTRIPDHLFDGCVTATDFSYCFNGCAALESIPSGIFKDCVSATTMASAFALDYRGENITEIPGDMFSHCPNIVSFSHCFDHQALSTIPANLFKANVAAENFSGCFNVNPILAIPEGLFSHNANADNFNATFQGTAITEIPASLFRNCPAVTSFSQVFDSCGELSSIPSDLFLNCPNVDNFYWSFRNCQKVTSAVPELWNTHHATFHAGCFRYCSRASNYADIPAGWK